jgi:nucleotide-binding universal stress UspA family protein
MPGIIVGVDGSEHSRRALGWAMREAASHQLPLTVINVQRAAVRPATEIYWPMPDYPADHDAGTEPARHAVRHLVDKVAVETGEDVPEIMVSVTTGNPAEELVRAARDADMLVIGSHGSGGFATLLLGSVSSQVVHHASCPVVVVPSPGRAG